MKDLAIRILYALSWWTFCTVVVLVEFGLYAERYVEIIYIVAVFAGSFVIGLFLGPNE